METSSTPIVDQTVENKQQVKSTNNIKPISRQSNSEVGPIDILADLSTKNSIKIHDLAVKDPNEVIQELKKKNKVKIPSIAKANLTQNNETEVSEQDAKNKNRNDTLILGSKGSMNKKTYITLSDARRMLGLLVMGIKNSGKSTYLLPSFIKQDLEKKDKGMTIIVSKKDMAYTIYAMAKEAKRKVRLLKPSVDFKLAEDFIYTNEWHYDYVNNNIIDYKEAIKAKEIIIIDMEYSKYRDYAIRMTALLLFQLQADMQNTDCTLKRPHYVYIDDAEKYLPYIELLLTYGDDYNVATTLFCQSRSQFKYKGQDYTDLIDNNVRNLILLNGITYADARFYAEHFALKTGNLKEFQEEKDMDLKLRISEENRFKLLVGREDGRLCYEIIAANGQRKTGDCTLQRLSESYAEKIQKNAIKWRKKLVKTSANIRNEKYLGLQEQQNLSELQVEKDFPSSKLNKIKEKDLIAALSTIAFEKECMQQESRSSQIIPKSTSIAPSNEPHPDAEKPILEKSKDPIEETEKNQPEEPTSSAIIESLDKKELDIEPLMDDSSNEFSHLLDLVPKEADSQDIDDFSALIAELDQETLSPSKEITDKTEIMNEPVAVDLDLEALNGLELDDFIPEPVPEENDDSSLFEQLKETTIQVDDNLTVEDDQQVQEEFQIEDGRFELDQIPLSALKNQKSFKPIRLTSISQKQMRMNERLANKILNDNIESID